MAEFLTLQLFGPFAAYGKHAPGEMRPVLPHPTKSGVLGLLAGALGIRRTEEDRLARLEAGLGFAVLVLEGGSLIKDYHTAQIDPRAKGFVPQTRGDELSGARHRRNTVLSTREYRCDALALVALWQRPEAELGLDELRRALLRPQFAPYLGRKACSPALPFNPQLRQTPDLNLAFDQQLAELHQQFAELKPTAPQALGGGARQLIFEPDAPGSPEVRGRFRRFDRPLSRTLWQYGELEYCYATKILE